MTSNDIEKRLMAACDRADKELRQHRREQRRQVSANIMHSQQWEHTQKEFKRRLSEGEPLAPLVEPVDLEALVGSDAFEEAMHAEGFCPVYEAKLRGVSLSFATPNTRALWQSAGQEHIERELLDYIDGIGADAIYFDVGASTGIFSLYAAAKSIRTYCFEPELQNLNLLNLNTYLNREKVSSTLTNFNLAVSDETKLEEMLIKEFSAASHNKALRGCGGADELKMANVQHRQSVMAISLDDFCRISGVVPTHIKVDVDGAELSLVRGMEKLLKEVELRSIFIEICEADHDSKEALSVLLEAGFEVDRKVRVQNYFDHYNYVLTR